MIKPDLSMPLPETLGAVHFVGIGGSGMSGIAKLFLEAGHRVTGSDRAENQATQALRAAGATVWIGHDAAHASDADALVYTGALWPDNPEYLEAVRRGIPVLHRSQALAWLVRGARVVAVAGAHGKTTSAGMIISALTDAGRNPSFVNGGVIQSIGVSAAYGDPQLWVIEADESDGSFLLYDTAIALITNVDPDHLDHFGSVEAVDDAFVAFASKAREAVVISGDDPGAQRIAARLQHPRVIEFRGEFPTPLPIPGRQNAVNAAGAYTVLRELGLSETEAATGLEAFGGTQRRFELHDTVNGVRVYDDYAHHPTEVRAALEQARSVVGTGRIIAVHQPHLYSRTRLMAGDFADVYEQFADHTVVLDVFGAREDPEPGVTGALVADRFHDPQKVDYLPDWQAAAERVGELARPGDIVMTLSCGDVYRIIPQLVSSIRTASDAAS